MTNMFVFNPADPFDSVDSEYVLITHPHITIQISPYMGKLGKFGVNEWLKDEEAMVHHGSFRTLKDAQMKALAVAKA